MAESTPAAQSPPAPHRSESTRRRFWKLAAVVGAFTLAGAGVWFGLRGENARAAVSAQRSLSLTAKQHNDDIQLRWDPQSEDIRRSKQGLLSIVDGELQTNTPLRSEDLLSGRIIYFAVSNVVQFRLKVLAPDGQWREGEQLTVRLRPESAEAHRSMPADGQAKRSGGAPEGSENDAANPSGVPQPTQTPGTPFIVVVPVARPNLNAVAKAAAETQTRQPAKRPFQLPRQPETPTRFLAMPEVTASQPFPAPANSAGLEILKNLPNPVRPAPSTHPPAEKPPEAMWTTPITSAVLVRQVKAIVPPDLQRMINRDVTLHVRLGIDESGDVVDSLQLGTKGLLSDSLFRIAAEAARQWKYQPARLGTQAVATILDVEFRFTPAQ